MRSPDDDAVELIWQQIEKSRQEPAPEYCVVSAESRIGAGRMPMFPFTDAIKEALQSDLPFDSGKEQARTRLQETIEGGAPRPVRSQPAQPTRRGIRPPSSRQARLLTILAVLLLVAGAVYGYLFYAHMCGGATLPAKRSGATSVVFTPVAGAATQASHCRHSL